MLAFALQMVFRTDKGTLRSPRRLDDGRVIVDGALTRTGVFKYRNDDGSERLEYRPPEEVFNAGSMSTFQFSPVTDDHPKGMVTAESVKEIAIGTVGENVRQDGNLMIAPLAINDAEAVRKLDAGKTQLSCGYTCDLEYTPGVTPEGEKYDAIQRNIKGNHVALVTVGRAGPQARIRMDGAAYQTEEQDTMKDQTMIQLAEKLAAACQRADTAETQRDDLKTRLDKAEAERDDFKTKFEAAEKSRTDAAEGFAAAVRARVELEGTAAKILGEGFESDGKTDREIKEACIKADCEGKSEDYVQARFDLALEALAEGKAEEKIYAGQSRVDHTNKRSKLSPSETAQQRMNDRYRTAWKGDSDKE